MTKRRLPTTAIAGVLCIGIAGFVLVAQGQDGPETLSGNPGVENKVTLDANQDGQIERAEVDAKLAHDFASIDTDGDGGISPDELIAHQDAIREARRKARQARRFARRDINGDGVIGPEEFNVRRLDRLSRMDFDGDGIISDDERAYARELRAERRQYRRWRRHQRRWN